MYKKGRLTPLQLETLLGTKFLGFSIGRGLGAPKGLNRLGGEVVTLFGRVMFERVFICLVRKMVILLYSYRTTAAPQNACNETGRGASTSFLT